MKAPYKIVIIGAGNVATHLSQALQNGGHKIVQVWSRTLASTNLLAKKLKTEGVSNISKINTAADIYILAIKDDAIASFIKNINLKSGIVVHTSGTTDLTILSKTFKNCGVFYPLQTFSKTKKIDLSNTPICIEANTKQNELLLMGLAKSITQQAYKVNSQKRKKLHLAAVFACNFSNYLYSVAEDILKAEQLPFKMLYPLIEETATKVKTSSPKKMQTGPAVRGDKKIMNEHIKMLENNANLKKLYQLISKNISNQTNGNKL